MQHQQKLVWGVGRNVKRVQALCFLPCWRAAYIWQRLHMTPTFPWSPQWYVEMFDESLYTAAAPSEILALQLQRTFPGKQKDEGKDRKKAASPKSTKYAWFKTYCLTQFNQTRVHDFLQKDTKRQLQDQRVLVALLQFRTLEFQECNWRSTMVPITDKITHWLYKQQFPPPVKSSPRPCPKYLSVLWNQALEDKVDSEHAVSDTHWIFDVIPDKMTACAPVLKNHKGLEVCSNRRKTRLSSV